MAFARERGLGLYDGLLFALARVQRQQLSGLLVKTDPLRAATTPMTTSAAIAAQRS